MRARFGRLAFAVAVVGAALGAFPKKALAHCRPEPAQSAPAHHHHGQENTESVQECPHCPPAECRRHSECASATDSMIVARSPIPSAAARAPLEIALVRSVATGHFPPPTPPPQPTL